MKCYLLTAGLVALLAVDAHAHDAPTKELDCMIFNSKGRHLKPSEMSEKETMQVANCMQDKKFDEALRDFNPDSTAGYGVKSQ